MCDMMPLQLKAVFSSPIISVAHLHTVLKFNALQGSGGCEAQQGDNGDIEVYL